MDRSGQHHLISWSSTLVTEAQDATRHLVWVGVDVTEARLAEKALQQTEILRHSQEQLRTLTAGLVEAQEEERRRVSQELHDDISQRLAALAVQLQVLHQARGISPEELHGKMGELQKQMEVLSEDLRRTARNLHPFMLTHLGLEPALQAYCEEFSKLRKIKVRFTARALPATIPSGVALCVYRVVQEALGNVAKHAAASEVAVRLRWLDDCVEVLVKDNGKGFRRTGHSDFSDLKTGVSESTDGFGLFNIQERVSDLGGRVWLRTEPHRGTAVKIHLPLDRTAECAPPQVGSGRVAGEGQPA